MTDSTGEGPSALAGSSALIIAQSGSPQGSAELVKSLLGDGGEVEEGGSVDAMQCSSSILHTQLDEGATHSAAQLATLHPPPPHRVQ